MIAVTISSVTPLSACGLRRMTSSENPSDPHGTKDKMPATLPAGPSSAWSRREDRLHHQAVAVGRVTEAPQGHREAAFGLGVPPSVGLADQERQLFGWDVAVPAYPRVVAQLLQPGDRLAHRAQVVAVEVEVPGRQYRLVAEPDDAQPGLGVGGRARLAGADHRWRPAVRVDLAEPGLDGSRPVVRRPDRIAAGQTDAEIDPIADRGAAGLGEDDRLVPAGVEVRERILGRLRDQSAHPRFVGGIHPGRPPLGTEQDEQRHDQRGRDQEPDDGVDPARRAGRARVGGGRVAEQRIEDAARRSTRTGPADPPDHSGRGWSAGTPPRR